MTYKHIAIGAAVAFASLGVLFPLAVSLTF